MVIHFPGLGRDPAQIGAEIWFSHGDGANLFAHQGRLQQTAPVILGPESEDQVGSHQALHRHGGRQGQRATGQLLNHQAVSEKVAAHPTDRFRVTQGKVTVHCTPLEQVVGKFLPLVHFPGGRHYLFVHKAAYRITEVTLFRRQGKIHRTPFSFKPATS